MLLAIIYSIYALFVLSFLIISFFIIYHLINYSINSHFSRLMVSIFSIVFIFLLICNIILFLSVDWSSMSTNLLPNNFKL